MRVYNFITPKLYVKKFKKLKQKINYRKLKQKIKSEIRERINCTNINSKLNNTIAQILGYNFLDLIKP